MSHAQRRASVSWWGWPAVVELRRKRQRLLDEIEELQAARTRPRTLKGRLGLALAGADPAPAPAHDATVQDLVRRRDMGVRACD
jgi:hypothetical protein